MFTWLLPGQGFRCIRPALLAILVFTVASTALACSSGGSADTKDGRSTPDTSEYQQASSREAPGDLENVTLPDTSETVYDLFQRLPDQVAGSDRIYDTGDSSGLTLHVASYGQYDASGSAPLTIHARDVQYLASALPGDRTSWTAGKLVEQIASAKSLAGTDFGFIDVNVVSAGREGDLEWAQFTTAKVFTGTDGGPVSLPVYGITWGSADGRWLFTAFAPSGQALEALADAFTRAAKSKGDGPVQSVAATVGPTAEPQDYVQEPPDVSDVKSATAPYGLGDITLPDTTDAVRAFFARMPAQVTGRDRRPQVESTGPATFTAIYKIYDGQSIFDTEPKVQATDFSFGDRLDNTAFEGWTAGQVLAELILEGADSSTQVTSEGRDGTLLWRSTIVTDGSVAPADTMYVMSVADADGHWGFDVFGETQEDIDALMAAFVAAANSGK